MCVWRRFLGDYYVNVLKKNVDMSAVDATAIGTFVLYDMSCMASSGVTCVHSLRSEDTERG